VEGQLRATPIILPTAGDNRFVPAAELQRSEQALSVVQSRSTTQVDENNHRQRVCA
jgi:hypothetical protein